MDIEISALIWARPFAALLIWMQRGQLYIAGVCGDADYWTFWRTWILALWRWTLAAARIVSAASALRLDTNRG